MGMEKDIKKAEKWLKDATKDAEELMKDPSKIDQLLIQLEAKLKEVPAVGDTLANLPAVIALVKAWITKEYTEISPKVIACLVGAIIYLVNRKDLIDDRIPVLGYADDLAVLGLALHLCEPELNAFRAWRDGRKQEVQVIKETPETQENQEVAKDACTEG